MAPPWRRREKATDRSKLDATPPWEVRHREDPDPTTGPFDIRDSPDDDQPRLDLGALRVPVWPGVDLRLDMNEAQQVVSVTLASTDGQMQLGVFAAPRNEGIWDEVRAEISQSLAAQGGSARDRPDGPFGTELTGTLKGPEGSMPVRFVGVDGPRWFLRAMLVGRIAVDAAKAAPFEEALRAVVVVRGAEPLPVRGASPAPASEGGRRPARGGGGFPAGRELDRQTSRPSDAARPGYPKGVGRLSLLRRLTADVQALDAADLMTDVEQCAAVPISSLRRGDLALVTGRLRAVQYTPRENVPTFTAELFDGSASIDLVWLGRRRIAGLEPGRTVFARGRVGVHDDRLAIYNPWYELRGLP